MKIQTRIEARAAQPYMAIPIKVEREKIPEVLPPLIGEVLGWLEMESLEVAGPAFFRYLKMEKDMLEVEVGVPVPKAAKGDQRVRPGIIPGGRYAVANYFGHYNNLYQVHATLEKWGIEKGMNFRGPRTEFYPTDPETEPDPDKWQTDITIMLAEEQNLLK